jgi:hypothetical protein
VNFIDTINQTDKSRVVDSFFPISHRHNSGSFQKYEHSRLRNSPPAASENVNLVLNQRTCCPETFQLGVVTPRGKNGSFPYSNLPLLQIIANLLCRICKSCPAVCLTQMSSSLVGQFI